MHKNIIPNMIIFFKRYLFKYISIALVYLIIILFTAIIASIGYKENYNYDSQNFIRQLRYILAIPIIYLILYFIERLFFYKKYENKAISIFHKAFYGKHWITVSLLTITLIALIFHISKNFFFRTYSHDHIEKFILGSIVILFTSFVLLILVSILFFAPIKKSKDFRRPLLILRSFTDNSYNNFASYDGLKDEIYNSVVNTITQRFRSICPTVLYDDLLSEYSQIHQFGSVPFSHSDNWLRMVERVSYHSLAILIIPTNTDGITMEINMLIKRKLLHKVYFLMPPENVFDLSKKEIEQKWEQSRAEFHKKNILLPTFNPKGMVFIIKEDFTINKVLCLNYSINRIIKLKKFIKNEKLFSNISIESIIKYT